MLKLLRWLDNYLLSLFAGFLIIFIPLYPKLPLLDALPGYIVRVRLEDFVVSFCILLWCLQFLRGRINLTKNVLFKPIIAYIIIGFLSVISAIFVTQTVPFEMIHVGKTILHYLRRIEYFSLFFIFYSTVNNFKILKIYISIFIFTVLCVAIYGFGQKYLYWPAFSTMNREFSKGWMLYLTEHARVLSTFGGHYDLAAFMMMALVMLWSIFFAIPKWYLKGIVFIIIAAAFWTLILTASRTSFIAYIVGITFLFFLWSYKKGIKWAASRWIIVTIISIVVMLSFGDLSERFTKLLKVDQRLANIKSLIMSPIGTPPTERALFLENNPKLALSEITSKSDQPPSFLNRPSDVFQDDPLKIPTAGGVLITVPRTYSKNAFMYDLSTAIRFDALWPRAISGFKRNPIFGSGYSTLNKIQVNEFTEAESTDNDYLRSLGETGLLGFISFFGTLVFALYFIWRNLDVIKDPLLYSLTIGLGGLLVGLLTNAVYIDVFESSKVAFSFWSLTGFIFAGISLSRKNVSNDIPLPTIPGFNEFLKSTISKIKKFIKSDTFKILLILILALYLRMYKIHTPLADWHSWRQADTSAVTRNYVKQGLNILFPTYDDLSNVASGKDNPKGLRFVEFPLYNIASVIIDKIVVGYNVEFTGRLTSILASLGTLIFIYKICKKYLGSSGAVLSSLFFAVLPYNIFYNRVILPEPFMVFTSLGMIYFIDKWIDEKNSTHVINNKIINALKINTYLFIALLFSISSILVKPFAGFLFLPMIYIWLKRNGYSYKSVLSLIIFIAISICPFILWRYWMSHFPEGIPANTWLFNGDGIRFKGAFFYWIFADRLSRLILGYWGLPLFIMGLIHKDKKENWFFHIWLLSMLLYVCVVATGNVRHDYYQIITIPIITIFLAKGVINLFILAGYFRSKITIYFITLLLIIFMEMFGWYHIRDYYNINHPEIVEAGNAVERKTHDKALVIAPYNGDTAFLYQTKRAGWPVIEKSIDDMIKMGADYYVSVNYDDLTKDLLSQTLTKDPQKQKYKLIEMTDKYVIIQLVPDKDLPK
ncbi:hypothetical protein COV53_00350 [Candidatus Gottesmanbacteria bacterium CG11_big_fil_rev_8_21_14_0_20_37_11]|uniref:Uncharacterized protein n=2 Tax=Candidatus Gottesmaniibacteriota TaxID=1752720 RepID=A0A2M7RSK3_9BACT|nr:MAG: hypothetical protein COX23_06090 [Candidatus Gottesmanbacteria bacterium CG23_combo_of_CG06-09_8_20_14_all_37_19]PIR08944.1 MAG: hypothetical protein COV53_00350 [Candidatus Gottesmanbacteria bacterium CG11_big_fil_rev_8_21_14_0_20_37_11]PIZ03297.1 MAG: hypothetical protein COY59_00290 [Candidatus Gottesmanbacteria bacterium CG_4_10_14_0_8_um_filter_37_24]